MYLSPQLARPRGGTYQLGAPFRSRARLPRASWRLSYLGALTPDQAAEQIFSQARVRSGAGHNQSVRDTILAAVQAGQMVNVGGAPIYLPGSKDCAGAKSVGKAVITSAAGTAGGLMLKMGAASGNPILLGAGAAAELASLVFGLIFGHHAAAVAKERSVLCAAVPAANDALSVIDQAVANGQFTPQQGIDAMDAMISGFDSQVAGIRHGNDPMSSGECNAACVMSSQLHAIVALKKSQYQDLAAQQAQAAAVAAANPVGAALAPVSQAVQSVQSAIASAGLPKWLLPAAGFLILYEVL